MSTDNSPWKERRRQLLAAEKDNKTLRAEVEELKASVERNQRWLSEKSNDKVQAILERDEARAWVEKLTAKMRVLTCVYCGHSYPPGSPDHGASVLTEHIKVCTKHPMRAVEKENKRLRVILRDLCVGHPDTCACRGCREAFATKEGK